tara:strand:+ start:1466 stop:2008 length:543 start_codon:yes stop_codon:yes gene_type:complete
MSCSFNGKISAEFTPPKSWELNRGLSFTVSGHGITDEDISLLKEVGANVTETGRITCKKGMKTDLASTPRILWNLIAPWDVARAAIIHDHLYAALRGFYHNEVTPRTMSGRRKETVDKSGIAEAEGKKYKSKWRSARALSDKIFFLGMKAAEPSVPSWKIYSAYWAVRAFGRWPASAKDV